MFKRIARLLSGPALALSISVGVLVVAELALRSLFPGRLDHGGDRGYLQAHPQYGYALRPHVKERFFRSEVNGGQTITWHTNAEGYRGPPVRAKTDFRVVVYGDSNIQAVFSRFEDTFGKQLEDRLSDSLGAEVEVINGGVVGYGPDHYLLRFVAEQPRLKADLVIFSVFADNDFGDLLRHRHFELQDGVLTRRDDFFIYPEPDWLERIQSAVSTLLIVRAAKRLAREAGEMVGLVRVAEPSEAPATGPKDTEAYVRELSQLASDALMAYRERSPHHVRIDSYDIDVATVPESDSSKTKVTLLRAILKEAKRHAMEMEVELLVVVQPSRVDVATMGPLDHRFLSRYPNYRRDALTGLVEGLCRELKIEVVNLFPIFMANEPNELYFRDTDNHWNDRGQAVAAAAAAQRVSLLISRRRKH